MKGRYIIGILLLLGCGVSDSHNNTEIEEDPYIWKEKNVFSSEIMSLELTEQNELYVATKNAVYFSTDQGQSYSKVAIPDSLDMYKIRVIEDEVYLIARIYDPSIGGFWGGTTGWLMKTNTTFNAGWEEVSGRYNMHDVIIENGIMHIGALSGIRNVDLSTGEKWFSFLFESQLQDKMDDMVYFGDRVLVSSHNGIYASEDHGQNWIRLTENVNKDRDHFKKMEVDENNLLYTHYKNRIYTLTNDFEWGINYTHEDYDVFGLIEPGLLIASEYNRVDLLILNPGEQAEAIATFFDRDTYALIQEPKQIEVFADGTVVLLDRDRLLIGTKNPESLFWQNRASN